MPNKILIIGSGFAGLMSALSASRLRNERNISPEDLSIVVVSPEPSMVVRPRLYEPYPETMVAPLTELFAATEINHHRGSVESIDSSACTVTILSANGKLMEMSYDRLIIASGSYGFRPPIPGLTEFGFSTTQIQDAVLLDSHLNALSRKPYSLARNTVVVGGAGFTGLEVATEMPTRLREIIGSDHGVRVVIVDRAEHVAPEMGTLPRPYIEERLRELGVESRLGSGIAQLDETGVILENGERIEANTVIWSAGMRASPLTTQFSAKRDGLGRILVEPDLRVPGEPNIFASGDTAKAATDDKGHFSLMSCQHARRLGSFAGHNAAADLLGEPTLIYDQPSYVTCLDLGPGDAVFTRGWAAQVEMTGSQAKSAKIETNTIWIYPPAPNRAAAYENALAARTVDF